eukprot:gene31067-36802_t
MTAVVSTEEAAVLRRQHEAGLWMGAPRQAPGTATEAMLRLIRTPCKEKLALYDRLLKGESIPFFDARRGFWLFPPPNRPVAAPSNVKWLQTRALVAEMLDAGRLPKQPQYIVVPDPPGRRLEKRFPGKLRTLRVLLIHAGGYSKRLPNHSHCGKIFSLLPVPAPADPRAAMTMLEPALGKRVRVAQRWLELKLATFSHVAAQLPTDGGGVLTTCSDDLIFYDHSVCDFTKPGFTAFGHPSPVTIGKDHGVFVLSEASQKAGSQVCRKFLHKPPIELQRSEGAVVGKTGDGADEVYRG